MNIKKTIADVPASTFIGKRVLVRVDFNVPLKNGAVVDDTRIKASLPTIKYLVDCGAKVILVSHLGRPKGYDLSLSLQPVHRALLNLLADDNSCNMVVFSTDCLGPQTESMIASLPNGGICLLENVRFYEEEEKNDNEFASKLAKLADYFVSDAFGTCHRAHASTHGVTKFVDLALAGHLVASELTALDACLSNPARPFAVIIGGSKVSSKISLLDSLIEKVDVLIIGGAMAFTFLKSQGFNIGKSLVEDNHMDYCLTLLNKAKEKNVTVILPVDLVIAPSINESAKAKVVSYDKILDDFMGLDIGPATISKIQSALSICKTIFWNGPVGVFEEPGFEQGTYSILDNLIELTKQGVKTVVGGGDSLSALKAKGIGGDMLTHVATGGGATLEYLEGKPLPGIQCLNDKSIEASVKA